MAKILSTFILCYRMQTLKERGMDECMAMKSLQSLFVKLGVHKGINKKVNVRNLPSCIYIVYISVERYILTAESGSFGKKMTGIVKEGFCLHFSLIDSVLETVLLHILLGYAK